MAIIGAFFLSLVISLLAIPSIIRICEKRLLLDSPTERKGHGRDVPTLGGVALFLAFITAITLFADASVYASLQYVMGAATIIVFIGIKDDLVDMRAAPKFIYQTIAALILIFGAGVRLKSLYGLFGIFIVPDYVSVGLSLIAILGIVNAFNLIDGLDGLAASIGLLSVFCFGSWFFMQGDMQHATICAAMGGALLGFLRFNHSPAKIFMGDTGSLLLGFICAILAISFIETNRINGAVLSSPAVAIAFLFVPLFDTLRVFAMRIAKGKSPFAGDKTHLHHELQRLGLSHTQVVLVLVTFNAVVAGFAYWWQRPEGELLLLFEILIGALFYAVIRLLQNNAMAKKKSEYHSQNPA